MEDSMEDTEQFNRWILLRYTFISQLTTGISVYINKDTLCDWEEVKHCHCWSYCTFLFRFIEVIYL